MLLVTMKEVQFYRFVLARQKLLVIRHSCCVVPS